MPNDSPIHNYHEPYWQRVGFWQDASEEDFISYRWQVSPVPYRVNRFDARYV